MKNEIHDVPFSFYMTAEQWKKLEDAAKRYQKERQRLVQPGDIILAFIDHLDQKQVNELIP